MFRYNDEYSMVSLCSQRNLLNSRSYSSLTTLSTNRLHWHLQYITQQQVAEGWKTVDQNREELKERHRQITGSRPPREPSSSFSRPRRPYPSFSSSSFAGSAGPGTMEHWTCRCFLSWRLLQQPQRQQQQWR